MKSTINFYHSFALFVDIEQIFSSPHKISSNYMHTHIGLECVAILHIQIDKEKDKENRNENVRLCWLLMHSLIVFISHRLVFRLESLLVTFSFGS